MIEMKEAIAIPPSPGLWGTGEVESGALVEKFSALEEELLSALPS